MLMLLGPFFGKRKTPAEIERDKKIIASLNKMQTIRVVGRTLYADAVDFEPAMRELQKKTRHLVSR